MLNNIQMNPTRIVSSLPHILSDMLPALILNTKACLCLLLKLLIINSITELLHHDEDGAKMSTASLSKCSCNLSTIVVQLHTLTAMHQLAIVALNCMADKWNHHPVDMQPGKLLYVD